MTIPGKKLLIFGHTNTAIKQLSEEYYGENIVTNNFEFHVEVSDITNLSKYIDGKDV